MNELNSFWANKYFFPIRCDHYLLLWYITTKDADDRVLLVVICFYWSLCVSMDENCSVGKHEVISVNGK